MDTNPRSERLATRTFDRSGGILTDLASQVTGLQQTATKSSDSLRYGLIRDSHLDVVTQSVKSRLRSPPLSTATTTTAPSVRGRPKFIVALAPTSPFVSGAVRGRPH